MSDDINTEVDLSLSARVDDVQFHLSQSKLTQIEMLSFENMRLRERIEELENEIRKRSSDGTGY